MRLVNSSQRLHNQVDNFFYHKRIKHFPKTMTSKKITLRPGFVVSVATPITTGMEIIVVDNNSTYGFGSIHENIGIVRQIMDGYVNIAWPDGGITNEALVNIVAYVDVQIAEHKYGSLLKEPKYHVDQVLFIKPHKGAANYYPSVGSPYETDIKITKVTVSKFGSNIQYQAYVPGYGYMNLSENVLITARERERIIHNDIKEYFVVDDLLPFFKKGERVKEYDGFIYSMDELVIVSATPELKKLLTWSIKLDK